MAVVWYLMGKGADPNQATTDDGTTLLYLAASKGHTGIVQVLLDKGADVNKACTDGQTALYVAAWAGRVIDSMEFSLCDCSCVAAFPSLSIHHSYLNHKVYC